MTDAEIGGEMPPAQPTEATPEPAPDPRDSVVAPEGLRLVKCPFVLGAYLLVPREWKVKHVDCFYFGRAEAGKAFKTVATARFAGALALIENGHVQAVNVPGLGAPETWKLDEMSADVMGWLLQTVAYGIEATQQLPFLSFADSSLGGTT